MKVNHMRGQSGVERGAAGKKGMNSRRGLDGVDRIG